MKLPIDILKPVQNPSYDLNRKAVVPKGSITLTMILGRAPRHLNLVVNFILVKVPFVYNMILSKPFIRMARVVLSTYHLVLKFPTTEGVSEVKVNILWPMNVISQQLEENRKQKDFHYES